MKEYVLLITTIAAAALVYFGSGPQPVPPHLYQPAYCPALGGDAHFVPCASLDEILPT